MDFNNFWGLPLPPSMYAKRISWVFIRTPLERRRPLSVPMTGSEQILLLFVQEEARLTLNSLTRAENSNKSYWNKTSFSWVFFYFNVKNLEVLGYFEDFPGRIWASERDTSLGVILKRGDFKPSGGGGVRFISQQHFEISWLSCLEVRRISRPLHGHGPIALRSAMTS